MILDLTTLNVKSSGFLIVTFDFSACKKRESNQADMVVV